MKNTLKNNHNDTPKQANFYTVAMNSLKKKKIVSGAVQSRFLIFFNIFECFDRLMLKINF